MAYSNRTWTASGHTVSLTGEPIANRAADASHLSMAQGDNNVAASEDGGGSARTESKEGRESSAPAQEGISAFVARILDQLSLTAWLPAALLTAALALLTQFQSQKSTDFGAAIIALTDQPVRILVLTIPALIIATMITQAFSFQAIRILEGYWRGPFLPSLMRRLMTHAQLARHKRLYDQILEADREAFGIALRRMEEVGVPMRVRWAVDASKRGEALPELDDSESRSFQLTDWRSYCPPWKLAAIDRLREQYALYPAPRRMLPTRLGNCMRSTEDALRHTQGDVESFVLRCRDLVPLRLQIHHDQFRNRLDMYCTLVFVSAALAALTPILLVSTAIDLWQTGLLTAGFLVLALASYQAAISSAAGYCTILRRMDDLLGTLGQPPSRT